VRHARQLNREVLGQWRKRPSGFGQHIACRNERFANGRQPCCTECGCSHQYGHNYNNNDYYDNDDNGSTYHDNVNNNDHNSCTNHYDNGSTNHNNVNNNDSRTNHYDNGSTNHNNVNNNDSRTDHDYNNDSSTDNDHNNFNDDNNRCAACVHRPLNDNDVNISCTNHDDNSAHSCATTHGQRIRQQFIRVKQRAKTATQQTRISVTRRRCGDMRGVSRVQCPQSPQPAHGETFAIGMHLSRNPSSRAGGHPKRAVHPVSHGSDHVL